MSFRIGRKGAAETYPQAPRGGTSAYARNSAQGPATLTTITAAGSPPGQAILWSLIESGEAAGDIVTVTPRVSGNFKVSAVINVANPTGASIQLLACVTVNGTDVSQVSEQDVVNGTSASLAIQPFGLSGSPIGVPVNFGVKVSGNGLTLPVISSTIFVEEIASATG